MALAVPDDRDPVEYLAEQFLSQHRSGRGSSIGDFAAAYPEYAVEIKELFPAMLAMEMLKRDAPGSALVPASLGPAPPNQLGEFRLLREIGRGGMGVVYEAMHETLRRHVAIKVLPRSSGQQARAFQREARLTARLHHANIVPLFGVGEQDGYHFIVMQWVRGVDWDRLFKAVRSRLGSPTGGDFDETTAAIGEGSQTGETILKSRPPQRREQELEVARVAERLLHGSAEEWTVPGSVFSVGGEERPSTPKWFSRRTGLASSTTSPAALSVGYWRRVAAMGRYAAEALHYAHGHRTWHRDIKPGNLLLDATGIVWITDFGLAKGVGEESGSQSHRVVGTWRYLAPERFTGPGDQRSDLYSLGISLYELATLQPAYVDASRSRLLQRIMHESPPPPRAIQPDMPADLAAVIHRAIARRPEDRYQTAAELVADLQCFLDHRPVSARPRPWIEEVWRRFGSHLLAALGGALGMLALATAFMLWRQR